MKALLVNGWSFHHAAWKGFFELLPEFDSVEVIDCDQAYSLDQWHALIGRSLDEETVLMGWSLGGMIAASFSVQSERVYRGLITLMSGCRFVAKDEPRDQGGMPKQQYQDFYNLVESAEAKDIIRSFSHICSGSGMARKEALRALKPIYTEERLFPREILLQTLRLLSEIDLGAELSAVHAPWLDISGDEDPMFVGAGFERHAGDSATSCKIEGLAHVPFGRAQSHIVPQVRRFLADDV